jgi:hypothetical protein
MASSIRHSGWVFLQYQEQWQVTYERFLMLNVMATVFAVFLHVTVSHCHHASTFLLWWWKGEEGLVEWKADAVSCKVRIVTKPVEA